MDICWGVRRLGIVNVVAEQVGRGLVLDSNRLRDLTNRALERPH